MRFWVDAPVAFDPLLHLGTFAAVMVAYRRQLASMAVAVWTLPREAAAAGGWRTAWTANEDRRLAGYVVAAAVRVSVLGLVWRRHVEASLLVGRSGSWAPAPAAVDQVRAAASRQGPSVLRRHGHRAGPLPLTLPRQAAQRDDDQRRAAWTQGGGFLMPPLHPKCFTFERRRFALTCQSRKLATSYSPI